MTLPPLPKQNKKREADFSILFRHWVMANPLSLPDACTFEHKQTTTDSIPFSALEEHQAIYSNAIRNSKKGVLMRMQGVNGEPDYCYYRTKTAFIVIKYPDAFHIITVTNFIHEKETSHRKSLTSARAREISIKSIKL